MKPTIIIRKSQIVNRKSSSLQNRSAFTLVELIVAVALASILILVTAMIFKQASSAFSESDARNEVYQNVRAAFDIIKRDISGTTLNTRYELFKAFDSESSDYPDIGTEVGSDILLFLSSTPNLEDKPVALITYYLKDDNVLYKREITDTDTLNTGINNFNLTAATDYQLGLNVSTLQFRYQDRDGAWKDEWETGTNTVYQYLPDAVEIKMTVSDTLNRYTGTSTNIISIP